MAIHQKLSLTQRLEELEMDKERSSFRPSRAANNGNRRQPHAQNGQSRVPPIHNAPLNMMPPPLFAAPPRAVRYPSAGGGHPQFGVPSPTMGNNGMRPPMQPRQHGVKRDY